MSRSIATARLLLTNPGMAYVITRACTGVCDTACVDVCPCDCIAGPVPVETIRRIAPQQRARQLAGVQLFIDPAECIDCGACVPECPEGAIEHDAALGPEDPDVVRNARFFSC